MGKKYWNIKLDDLNFSNDENILNLAKKIRESELSDEKKIPNYSWVKEYIDKYIKK